MILTWVDSISPSIVELAAIASLNGRNKTSVHGPSSEADMQAASFVSHIHRFGRMIVVGLENLWCCAFEVPLAIVCRSSLAETLSRNVPCGGLLWKLLTSDAAREPRITQEMQIFARSMDIWVSQQGEGK